MDSDTFLGQPGDSTAALDATGDSQDAPRGERCTLSVEWNSNRFWIIVVQPPLLILFIENYILIKCLYYKLSAFSWYLMITRSKPRVDLQRLPLLQIHSHRHFLHWNSICFEFVFWYRFWRDFSCKCIESAICACPHDRPHINALRYSGIILLYNHIKHTLRFI